MAQAPFDEPRVRELARRPGPSAAAGRGAMTSVSSASIPELFTGFRETYTQESTRLMTASKTVERLQLQHTDLLAKVMNAPITEQSLTGDRLVGSMAAMGGDIALTRQNTKKEIAELAKVEATREEVRQLGREISLQLEIVQHSDWRIQLMQILPAALTSNTFPIDTLEDVMNIIPTEDFNPSSEDREWASQLLNNLQLRVSDVRLVRDTGRDSTGREIEVSDPLDNEAIFAALQRRPTGRVVNNFNIQQMTTDEILNSIRINSQFILPPGVTEAELMELLAEEGLDKDEIDARMSDVAPDIQVQIDTFRVRQARMAIIRAEGSKLGNGELDSMIDAALWAQAASRPMVAAMAPFLYWNNKLIYPLAGGLLIGNSYVSSYTGRESDSDRALRESFGTAREQGLSNWEALRYVRENWDTNGLQKFLLDTAIDPLTYVGFGWYAKPFRALPIIGKSSYNAIGAVERGFTLAMEMPFVMAKHVWITTMPRTLQQRALTLSMSAFDTTRAYLENITGKTLRRIEPTDTRMILTDVITNALNDPQNPDYRAGLFLLGDREISADDLSNFYITLNINREVTIEAIDAANGIAALTKGFGSTRFLEINESAALLRSALDIFPTPENITNSVAFITRIREGLANRAIRKLAGEDTIQILRSIMDGTKRDFLAAQHSIVANKRFQQGFIAHSLDGLDRVTRVVFQGLIDKFISTPFARAYLLFGAYAFFNILETGLKTMLSGNNPMWSSKRLLYKRLNTQIHGLRGHVPLDALEPARVLIQADFPEEQLRRLSPSNARLMTSQERNAAEADVSNWVTKVMTGKWLEALPGGKPLSTITGYDYGTVFGGVQKANYWSRMYKKLLVEADPAAIAATTDLIEELMIDAGLVIDNKHVSAYKDEAVARLLTGDIKHVQDLVRDFSPNTVRAAEVSKLLEPLTEIYGDVADIIMRRVDTGELWSAGPHGINDLVDNVLHEQIMQRYLESPALFRERFATFVDGIIDWNPTTPAELNFKMNTVAQVIDVYGDTISSAVNVARIYGETIVNPVGKQTFYDNFWANRLTPHVNQSADDIRRLVDDMRSKLQDSANTRDMTPIQIQQYDQLLHHQLEVLAFTKNARNAQRDLENLFISQNGGSTRGWSNQTWDNFYFERSRPWVNVEDKFLQTRSQVYELSAQIEGLVSPQRLTGRPTRKLIPKDVADLFGVAPSELARNMYLPELLALRGKKSFVKLVQDRANRAGREAGLEAKDLGFSIEEVERIYDLLVREIKTDPNVLAGIEPALNQLENLRHELIRTLQNRHVLASDDTTQYLDDIFVGRAEVSESVGFDDKRMDTLYATQADIDQLIINFDTQVARRLSVVEEAVAEAATRPVSRITRDDEIFDLRTVLRTTSEGLRDTRQEVADLADKLRLQGATIEGRNVTLPSGASDAAFRDKDMYLEALGDIHFKEMNVAGLERQLIAAEGSLADYLRQGPSNIPVHLRNPRTGEPLNEADIIAEFIEVRGDPHTVKVGDELADPFDYRYAEEETGLNRGMGLERQLNTTERLKQQFIDIANEADPGIRLTIERWFETVRNQDLQRLGYQGTANMLYRAKIHAVLREQYPTGFIKIYRGAASTRPDTPSGVEGRVYINVTSDRTTAEGFSAAHGMGDKPLSFDKDKLLFGADIPLEVQDIVIRVEDVVAVGSVDESELIIPVKTLIDRLDNPIEIPTRSLQPAQESKLSVYLRENPDNSNVQTLSRIMDSDGNPQPEWQSTREGVLEEVGQRYGQDFPDYENSTAFTALMKSIFPFFTYEAHRWAWWLPREFFRHPGTYTAFGRYKDNTDQGYIHIPGTSLDVNPLRGGIYMGGMRRLQNRDYPEFYDQFGAVAEAFDQVSRYGYYPGAPIGLAFATFGAGTGITQFGEVTPAWMRTMTGGLAAIAPGSAADNFTKHIFPDRYRDFMTQRQVSANGGNGVRILEKRLRNESLTDEEQMQWDAASRGIGFFTMMAEQTSLLRFKPQEMIEVREAANELLSELTGVPLEVINDLDRNQLRFEDVFEALPPDIQKAVFEVDGFRRYTGGSVGLIPSQLGQQVLIQREFWQTVESERNIIRDDMLVFEAQLRRGERSMQDWLQKRTENVERLINYIESQKRRDRYRDIPFSIEARVKFAQENHMPVPVLHPMEEIRELYFSEPLKEAFNYNTGQIEPDWDSFFAFRNAVEMSLPDDMLSELISLNQQDSTSLEKTHYEINKTLFRSYNALFDIVLEGFPVDEQKLILKHRDEDTIEKQRIAEIQTNVEGEGDRQIISLFTERLRQSHSNLRTINPELDAWLNIFRKVRGFETPIAEERFRQIQIELGIS